MTFNQLDNYIGNQSDNIDVTFIVPCLNEERHIGCLIESIINHVKNINYELIIVDNGSTDKSVDIIRNSKAKLIIDNTKTIGGLRNIGADSAVGIYLVFLDADILLTKAWNDEIVLVLKELNNSKMITGSRCSISLEPSFVEKYWFAPMAKENKSNYINSAHLIVKKEDFIEIGGFSSSLVTAEDYEFCERARKKGFMIVNNQRLLAIHEGYPKSIMEFICRERWHGFQDVNSLNEFLHSKVALFSSVYLASLIGSIISLFCFSSFKLFAVFVTISFLLCIISTIEKRSRYSLNIYLTFLIFNIYFFSRSLAIFDKFIRKTTSRWYRE